MRGSSGLPEPGRVGIMGHEVIVRRNELEALDDALERDLAEVKPRVAA